MKIHLVTGATGFVGRHLVKKLLLQNECVWMVIRPGHDISAQARAEGIFKDVLKLYPNMLRVLEGDILKEHLGISEQNQQELQEHDLTIWHLAANLSFLAKEKEAVQSTNYTGTVNVLSFAHKIAKEFFYVSTAYVCGNARSIRENELEIGQRFFNQYEISKFQAEQHIRTHCRLPFLIFRPSIIIGDAHRGKTEGCAFGYYRYLFVFYFLKQQVIKTLEQKLLLGRLLRLVGWCQDAVQKVLITPGIILPYPRRGTVDLIPVDYVVDSMVKLSSSSLRNTGIHLTQQNLPAFSFLFSSALYDLGYRNVKYIPVPTWVFSALIQILYVLALPFRKYIRSIMWYTPYITTSRAFENSVAVHLLQPPPPITRSLMKKINDRAKHDLLSGITF